MDVCMGLKGRNVFGIEWRGRFGDDLVVGFK